MRRARRAREPASPAARVGSARSGGATFAAALLALLLAGLAGPAGAHSRSQSTSSWEAEGRRLEGTFTVDARRGTLLYGLPANPPGDAAGPGASRAFPSSRAFRGREPGGRSRRRGPARGSLANPLADRLASHLAETVSLAQGGEPCAAEAPRPLPASRAFLRVRLAFTCPERLAEAPAELAVGAFFPLSASHTHLLRIRGPAARAAPAGEAREAGESGQPRESGEGAKGEDAATSEGPTEAGGGTARPLDASREVVLTEGRQRVRVGGRGKAAGGFGAFLWLGAEHVLSGLDHLAFLAALLLLCAGLREAVATVTAFTLGHSATLAFAVLGWIEPVRPAVEALIGFSIAFAAAEALAPRARLGRASAFLAPALVLAVPVGLALARRLAGGSVGGHGLGGGVLGACPVPLVVFAGLALFALGTALARREAPATAEAPRSHLGAGAGAGAGASEGGAGGVREAGEGGRGAGWVAPALAVGFGLAHGAGFAGVLLDLEIPRASLASALLGFNLGVEAGQLAVVAGLGLGAAAAARALARWRVLLHDAAAAGLLALGVYWFVGRALGA